jgi:hypothetical protein
MDGFLSLTSGEKRIYCRQASERMDKPLPAAVIEKDFWVCWLLRLLNQLPELNGNITFKGGTSLSKAWGMIDRFSEDLDIAVNRRLFGQEPPFGAEDASSNTQRKLRLEELQVKSQAFVQEVVIPGLTALIERKLKPDEFRLCTAKKGNEVNIEFEYPGSLKEELGGLLPVVLIELVPRANDIPNELRPVTPILNEVFPELLGEATFHVSTLAPERTLLEKLLMIHETLAGFAKGSERKSRHYYDLQRLHQAGVFGKISNERGLLEAVVEHRRTFFRYNSMDYKAVLKKGVGIVPSAESLQEWRGDYERSAAMFHGARPSFDELMEFAAGFEKEFNEWVSLS